jgi:uncharacterized membrane protein YhaH (DUF805 family)
VPSSRNAARGTKTASIGAASIVMLTVKRLHDIGYPGPLAICLFILSPVVFITLCLWPGKPGANEYGP